jgi:muramoyltetrapeptide carboxypeptidase
MMFEEEKLLFDSIRQSRRTDKTTLSLSILSVVMFVIALGLLAALLAVIFVKPSPSNNAVFNSPIKPPVLSNKTTQTIGMFSPASSILDREPNVTQYKQRLENEMSSVFGLKVKYGKHAFDKLGFLAGYDKDRLADIHDLISDPSVQIIMANRGGWGCNRLIDYLDYDLIKKNPKIVCGYSDLTGLLNAIFFATGMITFHGPMGLDSFTQQWPGIDYNINAKYMKQVLYDNTMVVFKNPSITNTTTLKSGKAKGRLIGGNLSVFVAMIGSNHLPPKSKINIPWEDVILFLEDVHEGAYSIDRMFTTLEISGILGRVAGLVWGTCDGCTNDNPQTIDYVVRDHWKYERPAFMHAQIGHDGQQFTLPVGAMVEMDADQGTITLLETVLD